MNRPSMLIILPVLSVAAFLWTAEAWARAEGGGSSETRSPRSYQAPVDRSPEVLCGCTEVLKNFA